MQYRNTSKSVPEIARELRVDALVEASALRTGDSISIRVHLIRARPAERDLWAQAYDRDLRHVIALQRDVARAIARRINAPLSQQEEQHLASARTVDPEAYDAYLRGMFILHGASTPEDFQRGLAYLNNAVVRDSTDPLPWAGLALGYDQIGHMSTEVPDAYARAKAAATRAQQLGGELGETEAALAQTRIYYDWDIAGAEQSYRRAIALNSSIADAHSHYGWLLLLLGREDEAVAEWRRAEEVDPLTPLWPAFTAWGYWYLGRYDDALEGTDRALVLDPNFPLGRILRGGVLAQIGRYPEAIAVQRPAADASPVWRWELAWSLALAGRAQEAREIAEQLKRRPSPMQSWGLAEVYTALGEKDEAFRWLEAAYRARWNWMPWLDYAPAFMPLHGDPRFEDLLRRIGAPRCEACPQPRTGA